MMKLFVEMPSKSHLHVRLLANVMKLEVFHLVSKQHRLYVVRSHVDRDTDQNQ